MTKVDHNKILADKGIRAEFTFVPFSKSKNKDSEDLSLNWIAKVFYKDIEIIETTFFQGVAHAPVYKQKSKIEKGAFKNALKKQCEIGKELKQSPFRYDLMETTTDIPCPEVADLLYCLLLDADAINYSTYESWAGEFGYDEDSRKGFEIYHQCLTIGLKLRSGLGESLLNELNELFVDF